MKIYQFFLSSRGCLYRTKDHILVFLIQSLRKNIILCVVRSAVKYSEHQTVPWGPENKDTGRIQGLFSSTHAICTLITKRQRYFIKSF